MPVGSACSPFVSPNFNLNNTGVNPSTCAPGVNISYAPFGRTSGGICSENHVDRGGNRIDCLIRTSGLEVPKNSSCDAGDSSKCGDLGTLELCGCSGAGCTTPGVPACTPRALSQNCNMGQNTGGLDDCCSASLSCSDFVCVLKENVGK